MRLIDADAAADEIMRETENHADDLNMVGIALMVGIAKMLRDENNFPTIEAEPVRHGRWIIDKGDMWCSECGYEDVTEFGEPEDYHYCPNCGCYMKEDINNG